MCITKSIINFVIHLGVKFIQERHQIIVVRLAIIPNIIYRKKSIYIVINIMEFINKTPKQIIIIFQCFIKLLYRFTRAHSIIFFKFFIVLIRIINFIYVNPRFGTFQINPS